MATDAIEDLQEQLREFAAARDWEQFHTPKNLAMAIAAEAGELLDVFRWLTPEEAAAVPTDLNRSAAARDEIADIAIFLLRLADILDIDLAEAVREKMHRNDERYPAAEVRGRHDVRPDATP